MPALHPPAQSSKPAQLWLRRFGWLVLIWAASVAALGAAAFAFRLMMRAAGLTL